ncbi:hypothetical protein C8J57DRAFT_1519950 [Mycena rebaudengoi]|nr:hypothetical protein C8J57DRAFT_1519950 [Mycena rebaudengoi]
MLRTHTRPPSAAPARPQVQPLVHSRPPAQAPAVQREHRGAARGVHVASDAPARLIPTTPPVPPSPPSATSYAHTPSPTHSNPRPQPAVAVPRPKSPPFTALGTPQTLSPPPHSSHRALSSPPASWTPPPPPPCGPVEAAYHGLDAALAGRAGRGAHPIPPLLIAFPCLHSSFSTLLLSHT